MKGRRILIAVPCGNMIETQCVESIYNMRVPEGYTAKIMFVKGYSAAQARNKGACAAIDQGYDYILYLDSDQIIPVNALEKLLKMNTEIAAG